MPSRHHPKVKSGLLLGLILLGFYGLLAYMALPSAWSHYEHQRGLEGQPMLTHTAQGIPGDLALAVCREGVATGKAHDNEAAFGRGVALADDVLVRRDGFQPQRQTQQRGLLLRCERGDALQFADQRGRVVVNGVQDSLPW
jgi:hypothetical protein